MRLILQNGIPFSSATCILRERVCSGVGGGRGGGGGGGAGSGGAYIAR